MDNCKRGIRMTKTHTSASQFCEVILFIIIKRNHHF